MAILLGKKNRNVIPRWRDFRSTVQLGELSSGVPKREISPLQFDLSELEIAWQNNGTLAFAGDLLSGALLSGNVDIARDAAQFVIDQQGEQLPEHPLTMLARQVLGGASDVILALNFSGVDSEETSSRIAHTRQQLARWPKNAVLWVDFALFYAMQGIGSKARKAMIVALNLAPANRFVLRSAARLFIHLSESEYAHDLLRRSPLVKVDPWISSAEIATALALNKTPYSVDHGLEILRRASFDRHDTSELSTALATLEFSNGNMRRTKQHLSKGLEKPNENSLAQAKWISRDMGGFQLDLSVNRFNVARSFEAATWEAFTKQEWASSTSSAISWLKDQPFSSRPAVIASHLSAAVLEDYDAAERLAKFGQIANPHENLLHINLAFSYASSGRTIEALDELHKIKGSRTNAINIALLANLGLIAFRDKNFTEGRYYYGKSVDLSESTSDKTNKAAALTYWAREEVHARSPVAQDVLARAAEAVKQVSSVEAPFVLARIEERYKQEREETDKK